MMRLDRLNLDITGLTRSEAQALARHLQRGLAQVRHRAGQDGGRIEKVQLPPMARLQGETPAALARRILRAAGLGADRGLGRASAARQATAKDHVS